ncbi:efflux RND transporter periplasmic adaptor subunit [Parasulfuritortus cantonensis]|nr:HlyD family efflux transporter periplasmic adaptor subunit [Parasulfuritortus cantonensis]
MSKRLPLFLLALLVLAALVWGFLPGPVPVEMAAVTRGPLSVTVDEEGKTRVRERYAVSAPVAGYARRIDLKIGDAVAAGQTVAVLEPARSAGLDPRGEAQARAQVEAARAAARASHDAVAATLAEERLADQELARAEALFRDRFVAQAALDQARSRQQAGQANRRAAEQSARAADYQLAVAQAALVQAGRPARGDTVAVTAPVAGRVLAVPHESAGPVAAGQSLIEIGNPDSLEVVVEVLSTAAVRIAPGTRVSLDRWGGERPLDAVVRVVEPAGFTKISALGVEEQRVRVLADISTPAEVWHRLADGYRVEASFVVWHGDDVLQVPTSALFRQGNDWALYAVVDGRARLRPLRIGQRSGLAAQVLDGLAAGAQVIARPDDRIRDGVRVAAQ